MARTVVVIDDEPDLVLMLTQALNLKGFEVYSASSGDKGLELIEKIKPDAVVCDLMMPGTSGLEVCRQLRAAPETKELPLVVISGLGAESDKSEQFWAAGLKSDDFISKPFEPSELIGRLEYVLRKKDYVSVQAAAKEKQQAEAQEITAPDGNAVQPIPLDKAAPKIIVRSFIESWNTQDFETEYNCMDSALSGGLDLNQYIARRRQVYDQERGKQRTQTFVKVLKQRRTAQEATLTCQRKDTVGGRSDVHAEEYRLKSTPKGWRIVGVRPAD